MVQIVAGESSLLARYITIKSRLFPLAWDLSDYCELLFEQEIITHSIRSNVGKCADRLPKSIISKGGVFFVSDLLVF